MKKLARSKLNLKTETIRALGADLRNAVGGISAFNCGTDWVGCNTVKATNKGATCATNDMCQSGPVSCMGDCNLTYGVCVTG